MKSYTVVMLILLFSSARGISQTVQYYTVAKDTISNSLPHGGIWQVTENAGLVWICGDSALVAKADTSNLDAWTLTNNGIPDTTGVYWLEFVNPSTIYAAGGNGAIYKTTNAGNSWNSVYYNPSLTKFIDRITFNDPGHGMAWGDGLSNSSVQACLETTDGGSTWTNNNSIIIGSESPNNIRFVAPTSVFLAANYSQTKPNLWGVWRSTDLGKDWFFSTVGTTSKDSSVRSYSLDFRDNLVGVLCRGDSTLWSTSDGGITWQQIGSKLPTGFGYASFVDGTHTAMFAGIGNASVASVDLDTHTIIVYQDTTRKNVSFAYLDFPTKARGYMSNGIKRAFYSIKSLRTATAVTLSGAEVPLAYSLAQNYPNPFNPTTAVSYQLPAASETKIVVYDLLGREMAVLMNERKAAGTYEVQFDAGRLASGVYLYRLTAGQFVQTRKMVVVK